MVMVVSVRAVYQEGQLKLLEPVDLAEGQIVDVTIQPEPQRMSPDQVDERLRAAGILLDVTAIDDAVELSAEERQRIGTLFAGECPSEDLIDEDRGLY
jgi:predicted DNA-binding antitoxin AbrB/MazE fold protein